MPGVRRSCSQPRVSIKEDCGLILPIDNWVLREACEQARAWLDAGLPVMTMAVNVSATELQGENFLEGLFAILKETGLDPRSLEVEITESVLIKHAESAASLLQTLRDRGVKVSVDDFGTGYSSLSYLHKFAVDALKIDQSFVSRITSAGDDMSLVTAVISMARSLKLRAIAEGVETLEQLAFLQTLDCDEAQGFYFSRPVPPEQFAQLFRTRMPVPSGLALGQDLAQARRTGGGEVKGEPPAGEPPAGEPPAGEPPAGEPPAGEPERRELESHADSWPGPGATRSGRLAARPARAWPSVAERVEELPGFVTFHLKSVADCELSAAACRSACDARRPESSRQRTGVDCGTPFLSCPPHPIP